MESRCDRGNGSAIGCVVVILYLVGVLLWPAQPLAILIIVIGLVIIFMVTNAILTTIKKREEQEEAEQLGYSRNCDRAGHRFGGY